MIFISMNWCQELNHHGLVLPVTSAVHPRKQSGILVEMKVENLSFEFIFKIQIYHRGLVLHASLAAHRRGQSGVRGGSQPTQPNPRRGGQKRSSHSYIDLIIRPQNIFHPTKVQEMIFTFQLYTTGLNRPPENKSTGRSIRAIFQFFVTLIYQKNFKIRPLEGFE